MCFYHIQDFYVHVQNSSTAMVGISNAGAIVTVDCTANQSKWNLLCSLSCEVPLHPASSSSTIWSSEVMACSQFSNNLVCLPCFSFQNHSFWIKVIFVGHSSLPNGLVFLVFHIGLIVNVLEPVIHEALPSPPQPPLYLSPLYGVRLHKRFEKVFWPPVHLKLTLS